MDTESRAPRPLPVAAGPRGGALTAADIERRFTYHRPKGAKVGIHNDVRVMFKEWAADLNWMLPAGREAALAFTALEEASFWAHAAIAREGK